MKSYSKKALGILTLVALFFSASAPSVLSQTPTRITDGELYTTIANSHSDPAFYACGLYWVFTANDSAVGMQYYTSEDGVTWSGPHTIGYVFDYDTVVKFAYGKVVLFGVVTGWSGMHYLEGTPKEDGTIAWNGPPVQVTELVGSAADVVLTAHGPCVSYVYMVSAEPLDVRAYVHYNYTGTWVGAELPYTTVWDTAIGVLPFGGHIFIYSDPPVLLEYPNDTVVIYSLLEGPVYGTINGALMYPNGTIAFIGQVSASNTTICRNIKTLSTNDTVFLLYGVHDLLGYDSVVAAFWNASEVGNPWALILSPYYPDNFSYFGGAYAMDFCTTDQVLRVYWQSGDNEISWHTYNWSDLADQMDGKITFDGWFGDILCTSGAGPIEQLLFCRQPEYAYDTLYSVLLKEPEEPEGPEEPAAVYTQNIAHFTLTSTNPFPLQGSWDGTMDGKLTFITHGDVNITSSQGWYFPFSVMHGYANWGNWQYVPPPVDTIRIYGLPDDIPTTVDFTLPHETVGGYAPPTGGGGAYVPPPTPEPEPQPEPEPAERPGGNGGMVGEILDALPEPVRVPAALTIAGLPVIMALLLLLGKGAVGGRGGRRR